MKKESAFWLLALIGTLATPDLSRAALTAQASCDDGTFGSSSSGIIEIRCERRFGDTDLFFARAVSDAEYGRLGVGLIGVYSNSFGSTQGAARFDDFIEFNNRGSRNVYVSFAAPFIDGEGRSVVMMEGGDLWSLGFSAVFSVTGDPGGFVIGRSFGASSSAGGNFDTVSESGTRFIELRPGLTTFAVHGELNARLTGILTAGTLEVAAGASPVSGLSSRSGLMLDGMRYAALVDPPQLGAFWAGFSITELDGTPYAGDLVSWDSSSGIDWSQSLSPIPEPSSALLALLGLGVVVGWKTRLIRKP